MVATIAAASASAPRGWLSPGLTETVRTLDILAENGIEYIGNWVNDEQPYPMKVKKGSMISMPYSSEINDIPALLSLHQSPERFGQMICDQFDVLYEDGATTGRVMSICLHPFIIGHPHRSKYLAKALAHITSRQEVWLATGSEIVDWYKKNYLKTRALGLNWIASLEPAEPKRPSREGARPLAPRMLAIVRRICRRPDDDPGKRHGSTRTQICCSLVNAIPC